MKGKFIWSDVRVMRQKPYVSDAKYQCVTDSGCKYIDYDAYDEDMEAHRAWKKLWEKILECLKNGYVVRYEEKVSYGKFSTQKITCSGEVEFDNV